METETKNTVPLWLAVAITVVVSLPFGIWLDKINLPLWAAFIVWAEYFALGAKPSALKIMVPAFILGVAGGAVICEFYQVLVKILGDGKVFDFGLQTLTNNNLALYISFFVGFCVLIYAMKWMPVTLTGTLPFFNGVSVFLGVYFTGTFMTWFKDFSPSADMLPYAIVIYAAISAILGGLLGAALGWFNVVILFPRQVEKPQAAPQGARV
ncbi:MAG: DUF1097 domain-containing protein [Candidatus Limnocylindrales bacterium]